MVEMIFPDGTYVSSIVANLNVFTSNPGTSKGEGEIIYNSTTDKVYVNIGTTGSPNWYDISGSGEPTSHDLLNNLNWASAGHTFDAALNLNSNNLTSVAGLAFGSNPTISVPSGSTYYFKALTTNLLSLNATTNTSYQPLAMNSEKITGLATPTSDYDASTKKYVDDNIVGVHSDLSNLAWSVAGHTIDTALAMGTNNITGIGSLAFGIAPVLATSSGGEILFKALTTNLLGLNTTTNTSYKPLDMNSQKITGLATPTTNTDAATKAYVDNVPSSDGVYVCTSSTRPTGTEGRVIYETDTDKILTCTIDDDFSDFVLITGDALGTFTGYYWTGSAWTSDSGEMVNGLSDIGSSSAPIMFNDNGTWKLIAGKSDGTFSGFYWTGSAWVSDSGIVSGLGDVGISAVPCVFDDDGTWKLISGEFDGIFNGYYWTGSAWTSDSGIVSGLGNIGYFSAPTVFLDGSTLKLISGNDDGTFSGFYWTGSAWVSDSGIVSGLSDVGGNSSPTVYLDGSTLKLIAGEMDGVFNGYYWSGNTWISDSGIVSGLSDVGTYSAPTVFLKGEIWKIISQWIGLATSDLDLNGYGIDNGKLVDDLDLNGYNILDGSLGADLDANDYNIVNADTIQAKSTNSLTFKVSTGKSFVFQKV